MSHGICNDCGYRSHWPNTRGSRLADHRCPKCGGTLRGMTSGQKRAPSSFLRCAACHRRRTLPYLGVLERAAVIDTGQPWTPGPDGNSHPVTVALEAGAVICRHSHYAQGVDGLLYTTDTRPVEVATLRRLGVLPAEETPAPAEASV